MSRDNMAEPGLISPPDPTPLESDTFLPRLFGITATVVAIALIVAAIMSLISPDWLRMHTERRFTMVTPGAARKAPDPTVLASYPALPTGWHGAPIPLFPGQAAPSRWSVNLANGAFIHVQTDVYLPDIVPINLSRTYSSFDDADRDFGAGSSASYEIYLVGNNTVYSYIDMMFPDGSIVHMPRISPGASWDATYQHRAIPGDSTDIFDKAKLWWHSPWYFSSLKDGTGIVFPASRWAQQWGQRAAIMIQDSKGNVLDIKRDEPGNIVEITSPNGQKLVLSHDENNRVKSANDSHGYIVYYTYDEDGRLTDVTDSKGDVTKYTYDIDNNMLSIEQPDGRIWLTNGYDKRHRVVAQRYFDGTQASYRYSTPDPSGITITEVTRPQGSIDTYTFSKEGALMNQTQQPSTTPPKT
jgi:YD repeat-containing protein